MSRIQIVKPLWLSLFAVVILCPHQIVSADEAPTDVMASPPALSWPQPDQPLAERFAVPPADARIIKIVHNLPDTPEEQDQLFQQLTAQGLGGMVVNVSFNEYMESDLKWNAFLRGVKEAKRLGMSLWLYDECGYPSGSAGGLTLRDHPEYEARGLNVVDAPVIDGKASLDLPPGTLFRAVAVPVREGIACPAEAVDISASVQGTRLEWLAPEGDWHVFIFTESVLYEGTHAALSLARKFPYINLLPPEPTARFIEVTHNEYAKRLGDDLGQYFMATFTDEPSLMSLFLAEQKYRVLPWSDDFSNAFRQRRGYDMLPLLPALFLNAGPQGMKFRYDFWETVGDLVSENFFGQLQNWGRKHNIPSGGHLLAEESFLSDIPLYGNFFQCLRRLDAPSMDCLTSIPEGTPWHVARLIGSAAELEGRTLTMSETSDHSQRYRPEGDTRPVRVVTEAEIRGACNRLMLNGINTITSYYSFSGLDIEQMNRLNAWVGRCCTMLRGGHQVTDIALLYPVESAWVRFTPATRWTNGSPAEAHRVEKVFHDAEENLFQARHDFTHIDARTLAEAHVEEDTLCCGDLHRRVVVLPDADTLPLTAWENLIQFYRNGGAVIALTSRPANSDTEFPSPRVQEIGQVLFGTGDAPVTTINDAGGVGIFLPRGMEALLAPVLDAILEPDGKVSDINAPIRTAHRYIDGSNVYFAINDSGQPWEGTIDLPTAGSVEQWDPATGQMTSLNSGAGIPVQLESYGGVFYRFNESVTPQRKTLTKDVIPGITTCALPPTEPTLTQGQFVNPSIERDVTQSSSEQTVWHAQGVLTKSDVDTFLFTVFAYPQPVNLHHAAYLTVEAWLPGEQKAAVPLLVILRDVAGVEYLAEAGVPMNASGHVRCHVPINRFRRAGWCAITDKSLDTSSISVIRVGWGGYLGTENETVGFSLSAPEQTLFQ